MQPIYILEPISAGTSEIQVPVDGRVNVGREATNEYSYPHDLKMSSVHFEIGPESGGCRIYDLGSSNGLFLNTKRIITGFVVEGDEVQAGGSRWHLVVHRDAMASSVPESAGAVSPIDTPNASPLATPPARPVDNPREPNGLASELQLTASDGSTRILTGSQSLTIGRTAAAQWVFDDEQLSSCHMKLSQQAGVWMVTDLNSSNGTFVNGSRVSEVQLFTADEIRGGQAHFEVALRKIAIQQPTRQQPTQLSAGRPDSADVVSAEAELNQVIAPPVRSVAEDYAAQRTDASGSKRHHASLRRLSDGQEFDLAPNQLVTLGRSPESAISLAIDSEVSTQHATLLFDGICLQFRDVGSSNGSFVGGKRINAAELAHGDRLRVGQTEFVVCLPQAEGTIPSPGVQPIQNHAPALADADLPYYNTPDAAYHSLDESAANRDDPSEAENRAPTGLPPTAGGMYSDVVSGAIEGSTLESRTTKSGSLNDDAVDGGAIKGDVFDVDEVEYGTVDSGTVDSGTVDSGTVDSGTVDSGTVDGDASDGDEVDGGTVDGDTFVGDEVEGGTVDGDAFDGDADESAATEPSPDKVTTPKSSGQSIEELKQSEHGFDGAMDDRVEDSPVVNTDPTDTSGASHNLPEPQTQVNEQASPQEAGEIVSANRSIDLGNQDSYAKKAAQLKAVGCRSGLFVYLGDAATLQPVDVCLNLLRATSGWVLSGSEIENWIEAASQGLSGLPREWLNPSSADDASWMLPFLGTWGSGNSWLVLSHTELEDGLHSLRNLRQPSEGRQPLLASLTPTAFAEFLTEQASSLVEPFFAPFDAILLEVGAGEGWALVGRIELEAILQSSDL